MELDMKNIIFARPAKTGMQIFLLLAMLFVNFSPISTGTVYAAFPLPQNNFATAEVIAEEDISYTSSGDVSTFDTEPGEPGIPVDKTCDGHTPALGYKTAWYKLTPTVARLVAFNTFGSDYDTYIAVWKTTATDPNPPSFTDLSFVDCDDDTYEGYKSQLPIDITQADIDSGTTYYIQVAKYSCTITVSNDCDPIPADTDPNNSLVFSASFRNIDVALGGPIIATYNIPLGEIKKLAYPTVSTGTGPLQVTSVIADQQLISSMRVIYKRSGKNRSYSEMMGLPLNQATTEYYFPWYTKNAGLDSKLRIVNVGTEDTIVDVYIKGVIKSGAGYPLAPGESVIKFYNKVNNGPVRVVSRDAPGGTTDVMNIIVSMQMIYKYTPVGTTTAVGMSYSEMMGYPASQMATEYLFPWYKTASGLTSQLRIANVNALPATATVQVYIGGTCIAGTCNGTLKGTYNLTKDTTKRVTFAGVNGGPVWVVNTTPAVNIVASMGQAYKRSLIPQSYSEILGYPTSQLATEYQFPWYTNSTTLVSKILIVNVGDQSTDVEVYIGGNYMETVFNLASGASISRSYTAINDGPVRVVSLDPADHANPGADIITSLQIDYKQGGKKESYSELVGFPYVAGLPTMEYLFPWYTNSTGLNSELRIGYP